ncbi:MAG: hypothetical protein M3O88_03905 [Actinomycetota bacterium]|nr:hypothetical protein [Actinomycetota bacterium]
MAVLAVLLAPAQPAGAVADRWTTHGPLGATVSELVIDPSAPATVYFLETLYLTLHRQSMLARLTTCP